MRVVRARIVPLSLSLKTPLRSASASYRQREGFLLALEAEGGLRGQGEAMPLVSFGTESLQECLKALEDWSQQALPIALETGLAGVQRAMSIWPALEKVPAARHGIELALLDLAAQQAQLPLRFLFHHSARDTVAVNALLSQDTLALLQAEAREACAAGFQTLKLKVGARTLDEDCERVQRLRQELGPVRLRLDANGIWNEAEAREALARLAPLGCELCEQPVPASEVAALRRLQQGTSMALAADESLVSPAWADALLEPPPAVSVFVLKPMVLGGLLPAWTLAQRAHVQGVQSYVTSSLDSPVARSGAAQLAAALPLSPYASGLAVGSLFEGAADREPFALNQGALQLSSVAGLGLER